MDHQHIIQQYIDGWKNGDVDTIVNTVHPDCTIIESHGPLYRTREIVRAWAEEWFALGNTVEMWDLRSFQSISNEIFFEWSFSCIADGHSHELEGMSIACICDNLIHFMREYRSTVAPFEWEQ